METENMNDVNNIGSENGFTFDTCVAIKIFENPNISSLLLCHLNFQDSQIHLSSQTVFEVKKLGYDFEHISKYIQQTIGVSIITGHITEDMENYAEYLETLCPTLHFGDSQVLAYSKATGTTLITCDRGLAEAAHISNVSVVNPDLLHCNELGINVKKTKFRGSVRKVITRPSHAKQKVELVMEIQI